MKGRYGEYLRVISLNARSLLFRRAPAIADREYILRLFRKKDIAELIQLSKRAFPEHKVTLIRIMFWFFCGPRLIVVTESNGRIVGYNSYRFSVLDLKHHSIHETAVAVTPDLRGRGLAKKMRAFAWQHFSNNRVSGVTSFIPAEKLAAVRAAGKAGYSLNRKIWRDRTQRWEFFSVKLFKDGGK